MLLANRKDNTAFPRPLQTVERMRGFSIMLAAHFDVGVISKRALKVGLNEEVF